MKLILLPMYQVILRVSWRPCLLFFLVACAPWHTLQAQDDKANVDEDDAVKTLSQAFKKELQNLGRIHLGRRIELINQRFELSESDTRRLQIAAKRAAINFSQENRSSLEFIELMQVQYFWGNLEASLNGRKIPLAHEKEESTQRVSIRVILHENTIQISVRHKSGTTGTGFGDGLKTLCEQSVWTKAVSDLLTPEQQTQLQKFETERLQAFFSSYILDYMDFQLVLSETQRPRIHTWLSERLREQSKSDLLKWRDLARRGIPVHPIEDESGLQEILSDLQWELWQDHRRYMNSEF